MNYPKCLFNAAATAVQDFCRLIEQAESSAPEVWLRLADQALAQLENAMSRLLPDQEEGGYTLAYDLDARFELYLRLKRYLDRADEYCSEADQQARDGFLSGSLSANLADIYFELRRGMACFDAGCSNEQTAVELWVRGYHKYWHWKLQETRKRITETRRLH